MDYQIGDFIANLNLIKGAITPKRINSERSSCVWEKPLQGTLKFNVDGSSKGKPGLSGVLRNSEGDILFLFSTPLEIADSNFAEIKAIEKAVNIIASSDEWRIKMVTIESDSKVAISWVENWSNFPCEWWEIRNNLKSDMSRANGISFRHTFREGNKLADRLANLSVDRVFEFCERV